MPRGILIIIIVTVSVLDIASQRLRKLVLAGEPLGPVCACVRPRHTAQCRRNLRLRCAKAALNR
jgi:hypothetical protein